MQQPAPTTTFPGWISRWFALSRAIHSNIIQPLRKELPSRTLFKATLTPTGKITCIQGILWLTASHPAQDIVLRPGETFTVSRASQVIIEALEPATLEIKGAFQCGKRTRPDFPRHQRGPDSSFFVEMEKERSTRDAVLY